MRILSEMILKNNNNISTKQALIKTRIIFNSWFKTNYENKDGKVRIIYPKITGYKESRDYILDYKDEDNIISIW